MYSISFLYKKYSAAVLAAIVLLGLSSCTATYNQRMQRYESSLSSGKYEKAYNQLDDIKLLKKDRNRFLYLAEKGRTANLLGWYDTSNSFLNQADYFLEDHYKNAGDVVSSNLLNPMMETYLGEDFERFLVHFYKSVNYLQLGNTEDAMVEARRIGLENDRLEDAKSGNPKKYSGDAFSLMLQGIIFEKSGRVNDAFIAYRNAADLFLEKTNHELYGITLPAQLQQDVLRTATQLGFTNEESFYENAFQTNYQPVTATNGELILFWENGKAPVKQQTNPAFNLQRNNDQYYFVSRTDRQRYDIEPAVYTSSYSRLNEKAWLLSDLFRITLPYYITSRPVYNKAVATLNGRQFLFEQGIDVNTLATTTLNERLGKEITKALTRQLVKKLAETSAGAIAKSAAMPKQSDKKESDKTADEKKEEQKKKRQAEAIGAGVELLTKLFNTATEKADTRNWQSLPAAIQYVRIPLQPGTNEIKIDFEGNGAMQTQTLTVASTGGMVIRQISLLR